MSEINNENVLIQLRDALNRNSIKLWEEPYCVLGESVESEVVNLAKILSQQMALNYELCFVGIKELQSTALDNLKSIEEFNETGIATLKVRVPSKINGTRLLSFKIKLTENAKVLQEMVAAKLTVASNNVKIIANGKVLDVEKPLDEQGVKNNRQIMGLVSENEATNSEDPYARIRKIRQEAEVLLNSKDSGFLSIEDQSGKLIHLPENERRSIIMSLLLYEKGRVQLKNEKFSDALILFLEADNEIKSCQSNLVDSVDNIAIMNLDIVWCYLNLKSIMQLPDAEKRLQICEENFKKSYGENLSRVQNVKGSAENEKLLIARLHLMKGILFFHQNRRAEALMLIEIAENEIQKLNVDDQSVNMLIEMGYSKSEAVTGLRSSFNSIEGAVDLILDRRQKFKKAREEGRKERNVENILKKNGLEANPRSVIILEEMGFSKELSAFALQKSNGDISRAVSLLQSGQNELRAELANVIKPERKHIEELVSLGFDEKLVENVLKMNVNDFQQALDSLLQMQGTQAMNLIENIASTSSLPGTSDAIKRLAERTLKEKAAFNEISNDLDHLRDDDEYLTFTLEKEQAFLTLYKNALKK